MTTKFTALVPMKAHSERVPNKNIRDMCGKPLFYHIIETLQNCNNIEKIVVDTDGDVIKEKLKHDFPEVIVLDRPEELRGDLVPMNSIIEHDLSLIDNEFFIQTHSTNPLLRSETIDKAIETFKMLEGHDSLFSVNPIRKRCYSRSGEPINHDPDIMERTQDLEPVYAENSCIFLFSKRSFGVEKNRVGKTPYLFEMNEEESLDIDNEFDFALVNCLIERIQNDPENAK